MKQAAVRGTRLLGAGRVRRRTLANRVMRSLHAELAREPAGGGFEAVPEGDLRLEAEHVPGQCEVGSPLGGVVLG